MSNRIKAKANLKKSLYFSGSIAFVAAAAGVAVAVPTYNKIQEALNKNLAKLSDLSKYMSELTAKLGVDADTEFSQQLSDGYEVTCVHGYTQIYRTIDGAKTLVMNMNHDGTVGSAAAMTGLAAQKMLNVITEAESTLGDEAEAMNDILGPYIDAAEEKSMEIESAITGMTREELEARNALATNDAQEKADAITELKAQGISEESLQKAEAAATEQKETQYKLDQLAGDDAAREAELERQRQKAEAEFLAKQTELKKAYVNFMIDDKVISKYTESDRAGLMAKDLSVLRNEFETLQQEILERKNQEAAAKATVHQVEKATSSGSSSAASASVVARILANPSSFMNTFVASFGFDDGHGNSKADSPQLRKLFYNQLQTEGVSDSSFQRMVNFFGHTLLDIPLSELSNWKQFGHTTFKPKIKVSFNEVINTYTEERQDISRIIGVDVAITQPDGRVDHGYLVSRSSNKNILDIERIIPIIPSLPASKQPSGFTVQEITDSHDTLDMIIKLVSSKIFPHIKISGYRALADFIDHGAKLNPIRDKKMVAEIGNFASYIENIKEEWQRSIAIKLGINLGERILIKGENLQFRSTELIKALKLAFMLDTEYDASIITGTVDAIYSSPSNHTYLKELMDYITDTTNSNKITLDHKWAKIYEFIQDRAHLKVELQDAIKHKELFKSIVDANNLSLIKALNSPDAKASEIFHALLNAGTNHDVAIKAIKSTMGSTPISEALLQKHIDQLYALKSRIEWNKFMTTQANFTLISLLSSKDDLTYSFLDANEIIQVASDFDITTKENADKVASASGVSAALASQSISEQDAKAIKSKVIQILARTHLTVEQFKQVVEYTHTVFNVVTQDAAGKAKAIARLETVLDPAKIQENIAKIITFNKWVKIVKAQKDASGDTSAITAEEIENYVWTASPAFSQDGTTDQHGTAIAGFTGFAFDGHHIYASKHYKGALYVIDHPDTASPFSEVSGEVDSGYWSSPSYLESQGHKYVVYVALNRTKMKIVDIDSHESKVVTITSPATDAARSITSDAAGYIYMLSSSGEVLKSTKTISQYLTETPWSSSATGAMTFVKKLDKPTGSMTDMFMVSSSFVKDGKTILVAISAKGTTPKLYMWDLSTDTPTLTTVDAPQYTPEGKTTPEALVAMNIVVSPPQNGVSYAYIADKYGNVWRLNLSTATSSSLDATILFNLKDMKDQNGNPLTIPTGDVCRAINYDPSQTGAHGHQISIFWVNRYITVHDNTKEIEDVFNFLKP